MNFPLIFDIEGSRNEPATNITFTPDGKELFFVTDSDGMEIVKSSFFSNGRWSVARKTDFSGKYKIENPRISPDGNSFFFCRPSDNYQTCDIYVMKNTAKGWSVPQPMDTLINSNSFNTSPSFDLNGDLFFCSNRLGGWKVFYSKNTDGKYSEPVLLDSTLNRYSITEIFMAPDDSYLLFGSYVSERNLSDIFISFRNNNSWSEAISLGTKINSSEYEGRPCISPDGKYLFYSRGIPGKIYLIDWKPVLDSLRKNMKK
ncbi:MAG TPA: hypothetical protein VHO46_05090 [Bacteroidales bacterium]|nr:hypothetical protein [Bacteroidales bacterium]